MAQAIALAKQAKCITTPNPAVGCVLVVDDRVVSAAHTMPAGGLHAEAQALLQATELLNDATAYVTLEPCCHHGKTPPCTEALISSGVTRVVVATTDPNPVVAGQGRAALEAAGIKVEMGLMTAEAEGINAGFIKRMESGKPRVTIKSAMSMDGRTAMASGESKWITGEDARRDVQQLRAESCAILTGIGTVLADDPSMNVRLSALELQQEGFVVRQPLRAIVDTNLRTPSNAKIIASDNNCIIFHHQTDQATLSALTSAGANCLRIEAGQQSLDLESVLNELGKREVNEVLVEAGPTLTGAMLQAGLVDRLVIYMAPHLMGSDARSLFELPGLTDMKQRLELQIDELRQVGADIRITAHLLS